MADSIRIEGIEFHGFHGVPEAERQLGHRYRVTAILELDLRPAGLSDDVSRTVDYGAAAALLARIGTGPSVQLVETLAERMAAALLEEWPLLRAVELEVAKLHPPVAVQLEAAVVRIRRIRPGEPVPEAASEDEGGAR